MSFRNCKIATKICFYLFLVTVIGTSIAESLNYTIDLNDTSRDHNTNIADGATKDYLSINKSSIDGNESNLSPPTSEKNEKNESSPCPNWCRYTDNNIDDCWKDSLAFHANEVLEKVENLYSALLHIDLWKNFHLDKNDPELKNMTFEKGVFQEILNMRESNERTEDMVNLTTFKRILGAILDEYEIKRDLFHVEENVPSLPSLSCPVTCDYYPKLWATLVGVLLLVLLLFVVAVLVYLFCDSWSPRRRGKWRMV